MPKHNEPYWYTPKHLMHRYHHYSRDFETHYRYSPSSPPQNRYDREEQRSVYVEPAPRSSVERYLPYSSKSEAPTTTPSPKATETVVAAKYSSSQPTFVQQEFTAQEIKLYQVWCNNITQLNLSTESRIRILAMNKAVSAFYAQRYKSNATSATPNQLISSISRNK